MPSWGILGINEDSNGVGMRGKCEKGRNVVQSVVNVERDYFP